MASRVTDAEGLGIVTCGMGLKGTDYVNPSDWVTDLTYDEAHAAFVGAAPAFFGVLFTLIGQSDFALFMFTVVVAGFMVAWKIDNPLVRRVKFGAYLTRILPTERWYHGMGSVLGAVLGVLIGFPMVVVG